MYILGGGMAGCMMALTDPKAVVLESSSKPKINHRALLRFKSDVVSKLTGIPFKKVKVQKGIFHNGDFTEPNPRLTARYSEKVIGKLRQRSIMDTASESRWIAPDDFHQQMINQLGDRIQYGKEITNIFNMDIISGQFEINRDGIPIVSTIPMPAMTDILQREFPRVVVHARDLFVNRLTVTDCDMYSTVYFPGGDTSIYRASMTGNKLIVESMEPISYADVEWVLSVFGIDETRVLPDESGNNIKQTSGKIDQINDQFRKKIIYDLTTNLGIYSLGRYATWRNILLDDVAKDIQVIRYMINNAGYDARKGMS